MDEPKHPDSFGAGILRRLARLVYRFPAWFVYPQLLLVALSIWYTVENLEFSTSRNDLVGADKRYHHNFLQFRKEFGAQDDLVAVVESEDREKNRQVVERLGARLELNTNLFANVFYKGDLNMLGSRALLFLSEDTLRELRNTLVEYKPFIQNFAQATNLDTLFRKVNTQFRTSQKQDENTDSLVKALPALTRIVEQATAALARPGIPPSPGLTALFNAGDQAEEEQYITFGQGQIYVVTARARRDELSGEAVERFRTLARQTQAEVPGVNVGITGEPVLEYDEMLQSQKDSTVATIISLVLVALIFIYAYHETGRPMKATLSLIVGLAYTMAYTTLTIGHLNILTVTFLPILIGLAIDFGVHLITRYEEEMRHDRSELESLEKAIVYTGKGIFTGCFTTAGAFFAMGMTDFRGIQEMGIITGGGMLICLVPMMTFLPALLLKGRQNFLDHKLPHKAERRARIERLWMERPAWVMAAVVALTVLSLIRFPRVYFDYNLLNMQSRGLPAVEFEKKLIYSASKSVLFGAVMADSVVEAVQIERSLTNLPSVASIDSMAHFLIEDQQPKLDEIREIRQIAAAMDFAPYDRGLIDLRTLGQTLFYSQTYVNLGIDVVKKENNWDLLRELRLLQEALRDLRYQIASQHYPETARKLAAFQQALFRDVHQTFATLRSQHTDQKLRVEDLPVSLADRFVGKTGKHLLQVYPKGNVWERPDQEQFVRELRTVVPDVTGTPVQLYEYTTLLKKSYETAAWYALTAISLLVFLHFRSVLQVLLSLVPVGIGTIWMVGFMGWTGTPFNPANIMTLPLVIGIGVTNGIHILNRFAEEQNPGILAKSTGKAVLVSGLTTVAGFGSLVQAHHQGIASLGLVMVVGVCTCMIAALTFLPTILNLLIRQGWIFKKPSVDNALSTLGREEPR